VQYTKSANSSTNSITKDFLANKDTIQITYGYTPNCHNSMWSIMEGEISN
jgi:hypothetical protein